MSKWDAVQLAKTYPGEYDVDFMSGFSTVHEHTGTLTRRFTATTAYK